MNTIIGIDLGTSTTEAAVIRDGKPEMILNLDGEIITPSAVGIDQSGNWVIGEKARAQFLLSPENTAIEVKRKIGSGDLIPIGKQKYTPIALSSKLLEYVRHFASESLDEEITHAVISVPAYFNDIQRQSVVRAGTDAGFTVDRIINEPTAAALSYGLDHMDDESHILVYDLGGGTFDVTLLEMFSGVLEVKASNGDNQLGGKDFDQKLIDYFLNSFKNAHGIDLSTDKHAMAKIKDAAEKCKKTLSSEYTCHVTLPAIALKNGEPLAIDEDITADQFEKMCEDLLERTHAPIDVVLMDSGVDVSSIDKIILVGGSTRMPMVARDIEAYLGMKPETAVNPDYAVAEGAAIQAGIIEGTISPEDSLIMTDVCPFSLGIRVRAGWDDNVMSFLIHRNTTIPVTRSDTYYTDSDYQTQVLVQVYQGESDVATSNRLIGKFYLQDIPAKPSGEEPIEVSFTYNLNGILEVEAVVKSTGKNASIKIDMMDDGLKNPDDDNNEDDDDDDDDDVNPDDWKKVEGSKEYRTVIRNAERVLASGELDSDTEEELSELLLDLKKQIVRKNFGYTPVLESEIMELLDEEGFLD